MIRLDGKAIIVVGAGGMIGREIVIALRSAGAKVLAADRDLSRLQPELLGGTDGPALSIAAVDIGDEKSVKSLFDVAESELGPIGGAVNTAYPRNSRYGARFEDVTLADFNENLALHLGGYFLFMQKCAAYARQHDADFSLVNISSIYGSMPPRFDVYANTSMTMPVEYAAIKAALEHLTRYACAYMKGTGFRANCVSPGGILAGQDERFLERYRGYCMRKGMLDPQDIVGAVLYALSDDSRFMVGRNLIIDDGFSL
jgi:NAD(P)-dependent dehydrogenase (short-subunit alcohol dehydrogenase family)